MTGKICSVETGMQWWSSHRNDENLKRDHNFHEGFPPHGLSGARRGSLCIFLEISVVDPPRGRPVVGGGYIIIMCMGISSPIILSERIRFSKGNHSDT